jgi:hypothetical protein
MEKERIERGNPIFMYSKKNIQRFPKTRSIESRGGVNANVSLNADSPISRPTWDFETECISPNVSVCSGFRCKKGSEVVVRAREAKRGGRLRGNVPKHRTTK